MIRPDLSISIVSYNTRSVLEKCLHSIVRNTGSLTTEIFVVDNASTDGSVELVQKEFPQVRLIGNPTNLFYSRAHNQAWVSSSGEFFLILNSDVEIWDAILSRMVNFLKDRPRIGALTSRSYSADGHLQRNCSRQYPLELAFYNFSFLGKIFRSRAAQLKRETFYAEWDRMEQYEVEMAPGSLLMIRREAVKATDSLLDDRLQMYFSDNDLCKRIRRNGYQIVYLAEGKTCHLEGLSVRKADPKTISRIYRSDIYHYFSKYESKVYVWLLMACIYLTMAAISMARRFRLYKFKENLVWGLRDDF